MIRVVLPAHLRTLAHVTGEVHLNVEGPVTQRSILDALEAAYPVLRGTIRDSNTGERRAYVRFFACEEDRSHDAPDAPLPDAVANANEPFLVVGAIAGGSTGIAAPPASKVRARAGWILTGLAGVFMLFDTVIHLMKIPVVVEAFTRLGYDPGLATGIGIVELVCLALYLIPGSSIMGAVLLTGYLGGAVASNLRAGTPLFSNVLFPVYVGILVWGGIYLREDRLRALIPFRQTR